MGKISPVSAKYIIHSNIEIDGVVDRPDVIGAIFGQTEGLLGAELELRELQRSGRIGRIEVNVDTKTGKTQGQIIIPSSLDKAETAIVAASLEIINRIGPCNAKIKVLNIEDVRISKRSFVVDRAKQLLREMMDSVMPDSQEIADEVAQSVRVMEITEYGADKLPAGPGIDESDEVIVVEGRADVLNLLKYGFKNVIAMNGTSIPQTIIDLSREKELIVFVDGDRGGNLIIKELVNVADIDFVAMAPDGKEVEELQKKEIHKAIRSKITKEQALMEMKDTSDRVRQKPNLRAGTGTAGGMNSRNDHARGGEPQDRLDKRDRTDRAGSERGERREKREVQKLTGDEKKRFSEILETLIGTRGACLIDDKMKVMGKVPFSELENTLASLKGGIYCVVFDGVADNTLVDAAEKSQVKHMIAMDAKVSSSSSVNVVTASEL